jgi:hypothetical protein
MYIRSWAVYWEAVTRSIIVEGSRCLAIGIVQGEKVEYGKDKERMKNTTFTGRQLKLGSANAGDGVTHVVVPTLSAYAVEHSEFTPPPNLDTGPTVFYQDSDYRIEGDNVFLADPFCTAFGRLEQCRLVIHYHGIRDYALLFPQITDQRLKERY